MGVIYFLPLSPRCASATTTVGISSCQSLPAGNFVEERTGATERTIARLRSASTVLDRLCVSRPPPRQKPTLRPERDEVGSTLERHRLARCRKQTNGQTCDSIAAQRIRDRPSPSTQPRAVRPPRRRPTGSRVFFSVPALSARTSPRSGLRCWAFSVGDPGGRGRSHISRVFFSLELRQQ